MSSDEKTTYSQVATSQDAGRDPSFLPAYSDDECFLDLPVGEIRWSQNSTASSFFETPNEDLRDAHLAFRHLNPAHRFAIIREFPRICVVQFDTYGWVTPDNRHLFLFRQVLSPTTRISVRVATWQEAQELRDKLTTLDGGATIVIRS